MKLFFFSFLTIVAVVTFTSCQKEHVHRINQVPTADAGPTQIIQLPKENASLNGSGKDNDGHIVAFLWSQLSGPNTATIMNNAADSTSLNGLIAGVYVFQLMVTDNMGATGVDTVSVTVNSPQIVTLKLQPDHNPTEVHISGNSNDIEVTSPQAPEIGAASWTVGGITIGMRALLKFDLSSIPSTATILSAKLTLYSNPTPLNGDQIHANSGPDNTMLIEQVTSSWDPNTVKWTNQPDVTTDNQIVIPHTTQSSLDLVDIDVSQLVSSMLSDNSNNGFFIRLQTEVIYNSRIFCSSKYPDATKHPKLVIEYNK